MLFRRVIVWLVIGTVLLCPFPCLAEAVRSLNDDATVSCGLCRCCCPVQNTKPAPRPSNEGGTCLCHGAVLDHVTHLPVLELQLTPQFLGDDALQFDKSSVCCLPDVQPSACDFAVAESGRTIRTHRVVPDLGDLLPFCPLRGSRSWLIPVASRDLVGQHGLIDATLASVESISISYRHSPALIGR